jgi:hypothetical protein
MTHTEKDWITRRLASGLALLIACSSALATTDAPRTIDRLGSQGSLVYFTVVEGLSLACAANAIYLDITTDAGRAAFAELLVAKNSGRQLSRIDYTQSGAPGTVCVLDLVEIEN